MKLWKEKIPRKLLDDLDKASAKLDKLDREVKGSQNNVIYRNSFEWRFEFPEVLDNDGNFIGFDVIIGNPPYISLTKMKTYAEYLAKAVYKTYSKGGDIYCLFYERGNQILKAEGYLTYITSNSWLKSIYGDLLKKYFLENMQPINLLNIEDIQIFDEATVESNIITLQKKKYTESFKVASLSKDYTIGSSLIEYFSKQSHDLKIGNTTDWIVSNETDASLKHKIELSSTMLKDFNIKINRGFLTGYNDAFIINEQVKDKIIEEDPNCFDIIKPILRGRDLQKYSFIFSNFWAITTFPSFNINIEDYKGIEKHLLNFGQSRLEQSGLPGGRKKTGNKWFETQDSISYWHEFDKQKIIWGEISDKPKFAYDDGRYYPEATTFLMTGENLKYLLAILNSKVSEWYFNQISTTTGMGTNRWKKYKIEMLPIKITSDGQQQLIELVDKIIVLQKNNQDTTSTENQIDQLVYQLYNLSPEEIQIVESSIK